FKSHFLFVIEIHSFLLGLLLFFRLLLLGLLLFRRIVYDELVLVLNIFICHLGIPPLLYLISLYMINGKNSSKFSEKLVTKEATKFKRHALSIIVKRSDSLKIRSY